MNSAAILMGTRSQAFPQIGYGLEATRQRASEQGRHPVSARRKPDQLDFHSGALGQLGDRSVGPHPARNRSGTGQPAVDHGGAARRCPDLGRLSHQRLRHLARPRQPTAGCGGDARRPNGIRAPCSASGSRAATFPDFEMSQVQAEYESAVQAIPEIEQLIALQEDGAVGACSGAIRGRSSAAGTSTAWVARPFPRASRPNCWPGGPTSSRRSRTWSPATR